jgi:O-methyltransferase
MRAGLGAFFWDAFTAIQMNAITGDYVEFGSWGGNTLHKAYEAMKSYEAMRVRMPPRHLWAFDSFDVMPPVTDPRDARWASNAGANGVEEFHETCARNGVPRDAYTATEGYFDDTLPPLGVDGPPADIALAYIDCNMYSSTVSVFDFLAPRLKHGMIVGFDDYYCWSPDSVSGERAALHEFLASNPQWNFCRFKDIHWCGLAFVVEKASELPSLDGGRVTI